jgi:hypothetical protein
MTTTKQITRSLERMHTNIDWLDSRHSFSFAGHYDPKRMSFGPLRVVNDDKIAPNKGFPSHPHEDMEIVTLVLDGCLEHRDSMGNGRIIEPGEIQYMSAGRGVVHSEFNPSNELPVHLMQIWIQPSELGLDPRYADQPIIGVENNQWALILSGDGRDGSMEIRQNAEMRSVRLSAGHSIEYSPASPGRGLWLFVIAGRVAIDRDTLSTGDSVALTGIDHLVIDNSGDASAEVLLFDVPV